VLVECLGLLIENSFLDGDDEEDVVGELNFIDSAIIAISSQRNVMLRIFVPFWNESIEERNFEIIEGICENGITGSEE
jgi:hypothetical protein